MTANTHARRDYNREFELDRFATALASQRQAMRRSAAASRSQAPTQRAQPTSAWVEWALVLGPTLAMIFAIVALDWQATPPAQQEVAGAPAIEYLEFEPMHIVGTPPTEEFTFEAMEIIVDKPLPEATVASLDGGDLP